MAQPILPSASGRTERKLGSSSRLPLRPRSVLRPCRPASSAGPCFTPASSQHILQGGIGQLLHVIMDDHRAILAVLSACAKPDDVMKAEIRLRRSRDGECRCGKTEVKQTTTARGGMLATANTEPEKGTEFVVALADELCQLSRQSCRHTPTDTADPCAMAMRRRRSALKGMAGVRHASRNCPVPTYRRVASTAGMDALRPMQVWAHATPTYSGRPSSSMRFSTSAATAALQSLRRAADGLDSQRTRQQAGTARRRGWLGPACRARRSSEAVLSSSSPRSLPVFVLPYGNGRNQAPV